MIPNKVQRIVVGFSGGPDSVALCSVLKQLEDQYDFKVEAVHLNHQLRGIMSMEDENFCDLFGDMMDIPMHIFRADVSLYSKQNKLSLEEAGRHLRYEHFKTFDDDKTLIALGHHKNDLVETMFLNMVRGTGLKGLCGIPTKRDNIIRPLIQCSKEEIIAYLDEQHLSYRIDETNMETDYTRNKVRIDCIPYIESEINNQFVNNMARLSEILTEDQEYLEKIGAMAYDRCLCVSKQQIHIAIDPLNEYPKNIRRRVYEEALKATLVSFKDIAYVHYEQIEGLLTKETGKWIRLPGQCFVRKERDVLIFHLIQDEESSLEPYKLDLPSHNQLKSYNCSVDIKQVDDLRVKEDEMVMSINKEVISGNLVLRHRQPGDKIYLEGLGHKKLKKWFQEKKFTKEEKDAILMIADNEHVIWVIGYLKNDLYRAIKPDDQVYQITVYK